MRTAFLLGCVAARAMMLLCERWKSLARLLFLWVLVQDTLHKLD